MEDVDYSLIVLSCDKYQALWEPFFLRFNKHWPPQNESRYLVTNYLRPELEGVKTISIGEDLDWSSNLIKVLSSVSGEYVFIILEDVFLKEPPNYDRMAEVMRCLRETNANYVNTKGVPTPRGKYYDKHVREVTKGSHYRVSLGNAFWKKEILLKLLVVGESPWEFERNGTVRSDEFDKFFGTTDDVLSYHHVMIGGKVARDVADLDDVKRSQILTSFITMSRYEQIKHELAIVRNRFFSRYVPVIFRQFFYECFRMMVRKA